MEENPGLNLDTETAVLADIEATVAPWLRVALDLQLYLQNEQALDPRAHQPLELVKSSECKRLLVKVGKHIENCCARINERLDKDTYRSCGR